VNALTTDSDFFAALIRGDTAALDRILADDFVLIGVVDGSEIPKNDLLTAIDLRQLEFESIEPSENRVRIYHTTAVVTGRTDMKGRMGDTPFALSSRYTHVFVEQEGKCRLVAAQGTQIPPLLA
jgi:ketosteroid isomerase-like protein